MTNNYLEWPSVADPPRVAKPKGETSLHDKKMLRYLKNDGTSYGQKTDKNEQKFVSRRVMASQTQNGREKEGPEARMPISIS